MHNQRTRSFLSDIKLRMHMLTASGVSWDGRTATHDSHMGIGITHHAQMRCTHRELAKHRVNVLSLTEARPRPPRSRHAQVRSEDGRARALAHGGTGRTGVVGGCSVQLLSLAEGAVKAGGGHRLTFSGLRRSTCVELSCTA